MTLSEIRDLVCCLKREMHPDEWDELKEAIDASWQARVLDNRPDANEILVPTGSLVIEALPGPVDDASVRRQESLARMSRRIRTAAARPGQGQH